VSFVVASLGVGALVDGERRCRVEQSVGGWAVRDGEANGVEKSGFALTWRARR
jgi:hypothetical protein